MNNAWTALLAALLLAGPWAGTAQEGISNAVASSERATNKLRINFHNAPFDSILDYLSEAAGFIIHKEADVKGTFNLSSHNPLGKEEALGLINSVLKQKGYALIRNDRILTVVNLEAVKTADLEVLTGNDPAEIVKSDDLITQIIPVHLASASQLVNNLQMLLPAGASLSANEGANSLILVASKTVVRRMLRIVQALDTSLATVSSIKLFPLRYADAKQLATTIQQLFAAGTQTSGDAANQSFSFPGPPEFAGPTAAPQGGQNSARTAAAKVVAVADETANTLIVSVSPAMLPTIAEIVQKVDRPVGAGTEVRIFKLQNADPTETADQLSQLFGDVTKAESEQTQTPIMFGGPSDRDPGVPGGPPNFGAIDGDSSNSARAKGQVIAVADPRTSSVMVSASSTLMVQISRMIFELDASAARREVVKVFDLQNADPQDVNQVLQDLFNRNNSARNNNNTHSLLGQNNPLAIRQTQQTTTTSQSSGAGASTGQLGAGGAGNGPNGF